MTRHELLNNISHRDLRVRRVYARGHGYDSNVARVFPSEFVLLQREYPLFFTRNAESGHFDAVALLGFDTSENLFLGDTGWDADYVPLSVQRQPFLIGFQEREVDGIPTRVPVVHIDLDHPSVSTTEGEALFLAEGGDSPRLEQAAAVLKAVHEGHEENRSLSQVLVGLELVESVKVEVEFVDGSRRAVSGLFKINEEKLGALSGNALETLNRAGHLQNVFLMLASLASMPRLIERKNRSLSMPSGGE
jgi:hypothetical protein